MASSLLKQSGFYPCFALASQERSVSRSVAVDKDLSSTLEYIWARFAGEFLRRILYDLQETCWLSSHTLQQSPAKSQSTSYAQNTFQIHLCKLTISDMGCNCILSNATLCLLLSTIPIHFRKATTAVFWKPRITSLLPLEEVIKAVSWKASYGFLL